MRRLLLDTHIVLWALVDHPRLPALVRSWLLDPSTTAAMSVATLWEIAIKHALRPSAMPVGAATTLQFARAAGYTVLPVEAGDAVEVEGLPRIHSDPFDRLLVAQARAGGWKLVTVDSLLGGYGPEVVVVGR